MPVLIDNDPINQEVGLTQYGPATVPNGVTELVITLDRKTTATPGFWADGVTVSMQSELALNGTGDWFSGGGFIGTGGIKIGRIGEIPTATAKFPIPSATSRRIRLNVTVTGGTFNSEFTLATVP